MSKKEEHSSDFASGLDLVLAQLDFFIFVLSVTRLIQCMLLLQFSTSHYCRKARLALGYKRINYQTENLTPGLHILKVKPLTGLTTLPVLLPQIVGQPQAIGDSTQIFKFLETYQPEPTLFLPNQNSKLKPAMLEDWLDESIGTATRFVYYQFRAGEGKAIDPSLFSQMVIKVVRQQYGINDTTVELAERDSLMLCYYLSAGKKVIIWWVAA